MAGDNNSSDAKTPSTDDADSGGAPPDVKEQFRQALARKRGQQADGVEGPHQNGPKIAEAHSRAGAKREFRRKSGG